MAIYYNKGEVVNGLTILERDLSFQGKAGKGIRWMVECPICHQPFSIDGRNLRGKPPKSCQKCKGFNQIKDHTGEKIGFLTAIKLVGTAPDRHKLWLFKCDCGTTCIRSFNNLTDLSSCGCQQGKNINIKNIIGNKYNMLTVIGQTNHRNYKGDVMWLCQCDCGNFCKVATPNLKQGYKLSCGCISDSKGSLKIQELLKSHNIVFEKEKRFDSCRDCLTLPFDFYVSHSYLIEFDGAQHFSFTGNGWNTEEHFIKTQEHDNQKNKWCRENNIPLIRIPYYIIDTLTIDDLLLDTSQYIVEGTYGR